MKDELRIGNWILYAGMWQQVYSIAETAINIAQEPIKISMVRPILLSQEILSKCGFESMPHYTVMGSMTFKIGRGRVLSIGCVGTPNEILFITEEESIIVLHNFDYDGKLYLHRLQNIIHALTNTELIYKH